MHDIIHDLLTLLEDIQKKGEYESLEKEFTKLESDGERFIFTFNVLLEKGALPSLAEFPVKSMSTSDDYRNKANQKFALREPGTQLGEIIELYTKSIVFAEREALGLAYGIRSAASFEGRLYRDCLRDISRALALSYPDDQKAKLYAREARCLMALESPSVSYKREIKESLAKTAEYAGKMPAGNQGRKILENMLREPKKMTPAKGQYMRWQDEALMPGVVIENPQMKGVSSALAVRFTEELGRHVIATRNINPGEVLAVLKPYTGVLDTGKKFTHCAYCMLQTWSSIPCEECCEVIYCNETCKIKAHIEYHNIECQVMKHLIPLGLSSQACLALRLVLTALKETGSIQTLREKVQLIENIGEPRTIGCGLSPLDGDKYALIYSLVNNSHERPFLQVFTVAALASYIILALATKTDIFGKIFDDKLDEIVKNPDIIFIGGLLMRHIQIACSSGHAVEEVDRQINSHKRATVLLPFTQMNHTCNYPCVIKIAYGTNVVFYANYTIFRGQEVYDNYGAQFDEMPRSKRQKYLLDKYFFTCNCIACTNHWALYPTMTKYTEVFADDGISAIDEKIKEINGLIRGLQRHLAMPCMELMLCIGTRNKLLALTANRTQSINFGN